jgi:hypothetical protein
MSGAEKNVSNAGSAGRVKNMARRNPKRPPVKKSSEEVARIEALLDVSLEGTFPASDPVSICPRAE